MALSMECWCKLQREIRATFMTTSKLLASMMSMETYSILTDNHNPSSSKRIYRAVLLLCPIRKGAQLSISAWIGVKALGKCIIRAVGSRLDLGTKQLHRILVSINCIWRIICIMQVATRVRTTRISSRILTSRSLIREKLASMPRMWT